MNACINASYQEQNIQYVTANGRYMSSKYLILELSKDELYPEAVALIWDDAGQHYEIITYLSGKDDDSYYKIKTDIEKTGYILLKYIEKGTNGQVSL